VFHIQLYTEGEFRRFFSHLRADAEEVEVTGDVEAIIEESTNYGNTTNVPYQSVVANLGGYDLTQKNLGRLHNFVVIPVIKCYGEQEVVWIANGTTVIYHEKDTVQVLNRPLIKASVTVDQKKWHPMNPAEAGAAIANGKSLYANLLMDMIIRATNPIAMYDKSRFGNKPPVVGANGWVGVDGPVAGALDYPSVPQMNNGHVAFDNMLDRLYAHAVGQTPSMAGPQAGLVRGGLHAFESMMQSMFGRQRLAAMVMEMGYLEPLGNLAMIHMQLLATGSGMTFSEREYDQDTGKGRVKKVTVSFEDLQAAFEVSISARAKARTTTDLNERIQLFNLLANDPYFDPYDVREFLAGPYSQLRMGQYSREKSRQIQEQQAEQARQAQQEAQATNAPGGTAQAIEAGAMQGAV
jgi:hypothetical protein